MKTLPTFLGTGLLCAGLTVGCADSGTDAGRAAAPGTTTPADAAPTWVADANVTQAHLQVTGMD